MPVNTAFAVVVIGPDKLAGVFPQGVDTKVIEIVGDDSSGDEFSEGNYLVVAVVVSLMFSKKIKKLDMVGTLKGLE